MLHMSARTTGYDTHELLAARTRLAENLRARGVAGEAVRAAFLAVPRHVFLSRELATEAYEDKAIAIKSGADGIPVSASSQPAIMAIMLEQLELAAGQRVLEIGAGSGYNAALIAQIIGPAGSVVTVDAEPDLVDQARASLAAVGLERVTVVCGDGAEGVHGYAPYDRIIATVGVWDLAPAWREQLAPGGRIVAPISVRGIQLSVAFERATPTHWVGRSARRCGFVRLTGASAGPETLLPLGPQPGLHALVTDGPTPDAETLYEAISGDEVEVPAPSGLDVDGIAELADLDLWLALTESGLSRLVMMGRHEGHANPAQRRIADRMPLGGFAGYDNAGRLGLAALAVPAEPVDDERRRGVSVLGYGPGGAALAGHLAGRSAVWERLGRPGAASLELAVYPAGARPGAIDGGAVIRRPTSVLVAGWPTSA
jgi:protein-L-isoaspartate(D-aspartate) O-methyltransferase